MRPPILWVHPRAGAAAGMACALALRCSPAAHAAPHPSPAGIDCARDIFDNNDAVCTICEEVLSKK